MNPVYFLIIITLAISTSAVAQDDAEKSDCFFLDRECISMERIRKRDENEKKLAREQRENYLAERARKEAEQKKLDALRTEERLKRDIADETARKQKEAEQKEADKKYREKYLADMAAKKAEEDKQEAEWARQDRKVQKIREEKIAEVKSRCGNDYKNPAIGMTVERVKECVAPIKMTGQINRADGVASVYQYGSLWFNVMSGRVIAWGR